MTSSLIIPTESPIEIEDLKRALITYDKVYLPSPDDRELIPPTSYSYALSGGNPLTSIFAFAMGPVRPLGKVPGYDDSFQEVLEACKNVVKQQKIEVLSSPDPSYNAATIGGIHLPPDTPNPVFTYQNYRRLIENQNIVDSISTGLEKIDFIVARDFNQLAPSALEDGNDEGKGMIKRPGLDDDQNKVLSRLAHARLGSFVKYLGYCHNKGISPFTTDRGIASVFSKLEFQFRGNISSLKDESEKINLQKHLNTFQHFVLEELFDPTKLNHLSIDQVLSLRTRAWGKNHEAKKKFLELLTEIGLVCRDEADFAHQCKSLLTEYEKKSEDYKNELENLHLSLIWKLNAATFLGAGTSLLQRLITAPDLPTLLLVGSLAGSIVMSEAKGIAATVQKAIDARQATAYAIYNKYKYLM